MSLEGSLKDRAFNQPAEVNALRSMPEVVMSQIETLGFGLKLNDNGDWYVAPKDSRDNWTLVQKQERWFLCIAEVPQIAFHTGEMLKFLKHRN